MSSLVSPSGDSKTASECADLTQYNLLDIGEGEEEELSDKCCLEVLQDYESIRKDLS